MLTLRGRKADPSGGEQAAQLPVREQRDVAAEIAATSISMLVALGVRADGQKVLLSIRGMGGKSEAAWRALLDDLVARGLQTPELLIVVGPPELEKALAAHWPAVALQHCTIHKHRNLLAHAPERSREEISNDYRDMIYAATRQEIDAKRKAFLRK
jgi:putative transposase